MDNVPDNTSVQEAWRRQVLRLVRGFRLTSRISGLGLLLIWGVVFATPLLLANMASLLPANLWILELLLFAIMAVNLALIFVLSACIICRVPRCPACHKATLQFTGRHCPSCGVRLAPPLREPDPLVRQTWQERRRRYNVGIGLSLAIGVLLMPFVIYMLFYVFTPTQYGWYPLLAGLPPLAALGLIGILCPEPRCPVCAEVNECGGHCVHCGTLLATEPAKAPAADLSAMQVHNACEDALYRQRKAAFFIIAPTFVPGIVVIMLMLAKVIPDEPPRLILPAMIPPVIALVVCHRKGYTKLRCPVCNGKVQAGGKYHVYCPTCGTQLKDAPAAKRKAS
jgi:hypothetical protein